MASKNKKKSRRRPSGSPLALIRRSMERGDFKQALKKARVEFRQQPTPELQDLLGHVYAGRIQQLLGQGLRDDARRILGEFVSAGIANPAATAGLRELLIQAGMFDGLDELGEPLTESEQEELQVRIADLTILRPHETPQGVNGLKELQAQSQQIRSALDAVEQGDDSEAMALMQSISRQSLFADWRFFVRGLIAYYRQDKDGMTANWERLDEQRAAAKIATPLKYMAGVKTGLPDDRLASKIARMEEQAGSQATVSRLLKIRQFAMRQDWSNSLRVFRITAGDLKKTDTRLYQRCVAWLTSELVREEQSQEFERLTRIADPLPIDPHWNRTRAILESVWDDGEAWGYWRQYLRDLPGIQMLSPDERRLAQALVHLRLAEEPAREAKMFKECSCGADHTDIVEEAAAAAIEHFDACIALAPEQRTGYLKLASLYETLGEDEEAADVNMRLLEQFPDDLEALRSVCEYFLANNAPVKARHLVEEARKRKPLDAQIADLLAGIHGRCACWLAAKGRFDKARAELAAADQLHPNQSKSCHTLARKAALEIKADCVSAAREFIEQGQEQAPRPTAFWFAMGLEAACFDLPKEEVWLYEKRWRDGMKKRFAAEAASAMCQTLKAFMDSPPPQIDYEEKCREVAAYCGRGSRAKWEEDDLLDACEFLDELEEDKSLGKLIRRGLKLFPESASFHWLAAKGEIDRGPVYAKRKKLSRHLSEAVRLATASSQPRDQAVLSSAKRAQRMVEETSAAPIPEFFEPGRSALQPLCDILNAMPKDVAMTLLAKFCEEKGMDVTPEQLWDEMQAMNDAID